MSAARSVRRALAALGAAAALVLGPVSAAVGADELESAWDGPTVHLAWDGATYTTATESFVGLPVTVPGDRAFRRLEVTNDGPSAGVLRAWVADVELAGPQGAASRLFDDVVLDWSTVSAASSASLRELAATPRTPIAETVLEPGASTVIQVGYRFPVESTAGNRARDGELSASFDVLLRIEGEPGDPDGDDGPPGEGDDDGGDDDRDDRDDSPDDDRDDDGDDRDDGSPDDLPRTGVTVGQTLLTATLAIGVGMLFVLWARRRDESRE